MDTSTEPGTPRETGALDGARRALLDQILDKWSLLILAALCHQPLRFSELRRHLDGITQKSLSQALRRLERNGIVQRRVSPGPPVAVEYRITPLGRTLEEPFAALRAWTGASLSEVESARDRYDRGRESAG
jgi:DNA-binding HxlR family transcriptional regulator